MGPRWHAGTLTRSVATKEAFEGALSEARRAALAKTNVLSALREWCSSSKQSMRVVRTSGRTIHAVFEELEENNGLKTAVLAVRQIIDFDVRLK